MAAFHLHANERILTLHEALQLAIKNNKQIQELQSLYQKAKEGRLEAVSKWWPTIEAMSQAYKTQRTLVPLSTSDMSFTSLVQLTQSIISTERYYGLQISILFQEKLCLLLQAAINDVIFAVRTAYLQVILDKRLMDTAKENVDLLSLLVKRSEDLYKIGRSIPYNVNQSRVALANASTAYFQGLRQLKNDRDILTQLLGLDPACVTVETAEEKIPLNKLPLIACKLHLFYGGESQDLSSADIIAKMSVAKANSLFSCQELVEFEKQADIFRPDIRLGKNHIQIASQEVNLRKGEYFPAIDFVANYGSLANPYVPNLSNSFFHQDFEWGLGIELNWLLFDSFGREHRINEAKAEVCATKFNFEQTRQLAHVDVRNQIYSIEEALSNYATSKASVALADELVLQSEQQLEIGYITIFDYQIAIDTLIQSKYIYEKARFNLAHSYFGLRHATGIDLECKAK